MKRRNAILFVLTLLLSMVCTFALASCEEHVHTFSTEWSSDDTSHWHASTCEHTDEKSDVADHEWDDGTETTPATETAKGVMTYTCKYVKRPRRRKFPFLRTRIPIPPCLATTRTGIIIRLPAVITTRKRIILRTTLTTA